jgi:putative peptidoglycan lipid II flippase
LVQLLFQLPFLISAGVLAKPKWAWNDPQVAKVRRLMIPALFGVSVAQINLLLDTLIASFLETGSISWLYFSDRLLEFPLGLFGIAIGTVILPALSQRHVAGDQVGFSRNLIWAVSVVCLLGIPASVGLVMLAEPLLLVIFARGEFSVLDGYQASLSLMAYGNGLIFFMLIKILAPGFFSRQDTKTPVKIGIGCMLANMVFNLILVVPFGYVGLAAATSLSAMLNAGLLYFILHRQDVLTLPRRAKILLMKIIFGAVVMGTVIYYCSPDIGFWQTAPFTNKVLGLGKIITLAFTSYVGTLLICGVRPNTFMRGETSEVK